MSKCHIQIFNIFFKLRIQIVIKCLFKLFEIPIFEKFSRNRLNQSWILEKISTQVCKGRNMKIRCVYQLLFLLGFFRGRDWGRHTMGKINRKDGMRYNRKFNCHLLFYRNALKVLDILIFVCIFSYRNLQNMNHSKYLQYMIINSYKELKEDSK